MISWLSEGGMNRKKKTVALAIGEQGKKNWLTIASSISRSDSM